jgi:hypothetical protein
MRRWKGPSPPAIPFRSAATVSLATVYGRFALDSGDIVTRLRLGATNASERRLTCEPADNPVP